MSDLTVFLGTQKKKSICTAVYEEIGFTFGKCASGVSDTEEKVTYFGIAGGLGETGIGYVVQWRDEEATNTNPWLVSLTKGLGDSTALVIEHANNDGSDANTTQVGLVVNF